MKIALCCRSVNKLNVMIGFLNRYTAANPSYELGTDIFSGLDKLDSSGTSFALILVDISANNVHDFLLARDIQRDFPATAFIFMSDNPNLTLNLKGLHSCFHYAYSLPYPAFEQVLSQGLSAYMLNGQSYTITYQYQTVSLPIRQMTYIESQGRLLFFHHYNDDENNPYKKYGRLKDVEAEFAPYGFIRCHNSFVVNPAYSLRLTSDHIELANGSDQPPSIIPIGKIFQKQVHTFWASYHCLHL